MIKLYVEGHSALTPLSEIVHAFTNEKIEFADSADLADVISRYDGQKITTVIKYNDNCFSAEDTVMPSKIRNEKQRLGDAVKLGYYKLASRLLGKTLPWGIITGIRPGKLAGEFAQAGEMEEFKKRFCVSDKKTELSLIAGETQKPIKSGIDENDICVYIGIPFCPSRCLYCSFVSLPMDKQQKLIEPYVNCLIKEIKQTAGIIKSAGKTVRALYIGGGTPTSLNEDLFAKVVSVAGEYFNGESLKEFTVEAGRADTITENKLKAAADAGMTRVCINPQTMNNDILKGIGRKHTAEDFEKAFALAKNMGIEHINTDVIAGLPGETVQMFEESLDRLLMLKPDGVTVHTMCVKRAADLKSAQFKSYDAEKMVNFSFDRLMDKGYAPYYLYRQKDTLSCLENTGFAKQGKESFYNIFMMEDLGTVVGIGAGSVTKIKTDGKNKFRRVYNFKNPAEYISDFDKLMERKESYGL